MNSNSAPDQITQLMAENQRLRDQLIALEQDTARFRDIVHTTPLAVAIAQISTGLLRYGNPACGRFLGCSEAELIGMSITDMFAEDPQYVLELFGLCIAQGTWQGELRYQRKDGTIFTADLVANVLYNATGAPESVVGFMRDLTEAKQQEAVLRTFKLLVENAPDGIGITDTNLTLTYANPAFEAMLAHPTTVVGQVLPALIMPDDRDRLDQLAAQVLRDGTARDQVRYQRGDGTAITAQFAGLMLHDTQNNPIGFASINRDISEQLAADETLRKSEQRNRVLIGAIPDLMFLLSADGVFLDYKAEHESDLALPAEMFLQRRVVDVLPPALATQVMQYIETALRTREMQLFEYQLPLPTGTRDFEARMVPSNTDALMLARDITERKRAEQERLELQEQVIAAQQAALRELSTPLMPIAKGVVVMPIIGTIDSARAQQVMETLLVGISEHDAEIAILDITGVKMVDTQVAGALIRAAQAARMLGTQVVISGISPEIAQTLVYVGAELREMVAKRSLKQAIAYALER